MSKNSDTIRLEIEEKGNFGDQFGVSMQFWIRGNKLGHHLMRFVENIETLISDWLVVNYDASVPCTKCKAENIIPVHQFPVQEIEKCITDHQSKILCGNTHLLDVAKLAPDISLDDFEHIPYTAIQVGKILGEGAFAKAFLGNWKGTNVAVKELNLAGQSIIPRNIFQELRKEASIMSVLQHKNIVSLLGLCVDAKLCIVLEYMALGQLYEFLHDTKNSVTPSMMLKIAKDIAAGMAFMHSHNPPIIHRDLKSPNILLNMEKNEKGEEVIIAKISDFGFSRLTLLVDSLKEKPVDNPVWLAPELLRKENYDEKVDTYAYGVILWELVSRADFFGEIPSLIELEDAILAGKRPIIDPSFSLRFPEFTKLIRRCWADAPVDRPEFELICEILACCEKGEFEKGDILRWEVEQNNGDEEEGEATTTTTNLPRIFIDSEKEAEKTPEKKRKNSSKELEKLNDCLSPKAAGNLSRKAKPGGLWRSGTFPNSSKSSEEDGGGGRDNRGKHLLRSPRVHLGQVVHSLNLSDSQSDGEGN